MIEVFSLDCIKRSNEEEANYQIIQLVQLKYQLEVQLDFSIYHYNFCLFS